MPNRYLLDTHAWIWLIENSEELSDADRAFLNHAQKAASLCVSVMSVWEIAMLVSKARIKLARSLEDWLALSFADDEIALLPLTSTIAVAANSLPGDIHRDPVDRILAATARVEDLTLVTQDSDLLRYAGEGHLSAKHI